MQVGDRPIHMCGMFFFGFRLRFPSVASVSVPAVFETFKCLQENGLQVFWLREQFGMKFWTFEKSSPKHPPFGKRTGLGSAHE
jgi:hypothetical protein